LKTPLPSLLLCLCLPAVARAQAQSPPIEIGPAPQIVERTGREVSLEEALRRAARRNLTIRVAHEGVAEAEGTLTKAWSAFLPRVSAEATYTILDQARETETFPGLDPIQLQPRTNLAGTATVALPLLHLDAFPNLANARAGRRAAELAEAEARRQIELAVARAYYAILGAHRFRDLQVRARANAVQHLEDARARVEAGVGVRLDVTRAALEVEQATVSIIAAQALEEDAYDALAVLLDLRGPYRVVEPAGTTPPADAVGALVQRAFARRADLRLARLRTEIADRSVTAAWGTFAPTLDLAFNLTYTEFVGEFSGGDHLNWNVVLLLGLPIYDGGYRYGTLDERRAATRAAAIRERELAENASLEVRKAHRGWRTSVARVDAARRQVALAQEALRLARAAYEAGTSTSLEVVDTQRQQRDAEANLLVATYDSQVALANLLLASGLPLR
jgi:outer membrane protein TolC